MHENSDNFAISKILGTLKSLLKYTRKILTKLQTNNQTAKFVCSVLLVYNMAVIGHNTENIQV